NDALSGRDLASQTALDQVMLDLDGSPNKSRLGANAILATSLAFARAAAADHGLSLYRHFASILSPDTEPATLPRPTVNLFSGGKHAGGQVEIQDVLIAAKAPTIDAALADTYAVYQSAADLCRAKYGMRALVADEGGLAPAFPNVETMLDDAVAAIRDAGFTPATDIALCIDVAASHFSDAGRYHLGGEALTSAGMIDRIAAWLDRAPIVSVEDGLAEDDWDNWPALRVRLAGRAVTLGDDLLTTNPDRIRRAVAANAADALLLKVNQIGTLTEAAEACRLARAAGWRVVVSARSGETEDDWLTDLAVGWSADALKVGSIARSERLAKWNRLLAIEAETRLPVVAWPNGTNPP
ncbi:MAG TPA: enolase C-terminal domain-like protein, partial [Thermomicrobiales bacterium]